jgi:hypothetical protein
MTRAIFLLAAVQLLGSEADRAVLSAMRMSAPDVCCIHTLRREPVDKELDLVLAIGTPKAWGPIKAGGAAYWGYQTPLGIFLQRRDRPGIVYKISVSQNSEDCEVNVERLTATDAVLSCTPDKGGPGPNHKFVYDLHLKSLVKEFTYPQFGLQRVLPANWS